MELKNEMQFEIAEGFMANLSGSRKFTVIEVNGESLVVQMDKSTRRSVFPMDCVRHWVKRELLNPIIEEPKKNA